MEACALTGTDERVGHFADLSGGHLMREIYDSVDWIAEPSRVVPSNELQFLVKQAGRLSSESRTGFPRTQALVFDGARVHGRNWAKITEHLDVNHA